MAHCWGPSRRPAAPPPPPPKGQGQAKLRPRASSLEPLAMHNRWIDGLIIINLFIFSEQHPLDFRGRLGLFCFLGKEIHFLAIQTIQGINDSWNIQKGGAEHEANPSSGLVSNFRKRYIYFKKMIGVEVLIFEKSMIC